MRKLGLDPTAALGPRRSGTRAVLMRADSGEALGIAAALSRHIPIYALGHRFFRGAAEVHSADGKRFARLFVRTADLRSALGRLGLDMDQPGVAGRG